MQYVDLKEEEKVVTEFIVPVEGSSLCCSACLITKQNLVRAFLVSPTYRHCEGDRRGIAVCEPCAEAIKQVFQNQSSL